MPKSSRQQIDEDEKKFLQILQQNSGESIENIAKKCGFSRQKVWRIKKRMEKNKTIWGYNAVIDYEKINLKQYLVFIKRSNNPVSTNQLDTITQRKLKKELAKLGVNVECSYYIHGSFDWFLCLTAENIRDVKKFIEGFTRMFNEVVSEIKIQEVIFPVEKNNFTNPNIDQIKDFFQP
jgi:DNA-binding Lrp family transcriptional regulator